jgi:hypothetical protein
MKLKRIVNQLRAVLPKFSSKFNTAVSISTLTSSGSTATATSTDHGYSVGDFVLIKGAKVPYTVSSLTRLGTQATAITSSDHQIVYEEDATVEISGANETDYNGTKTLVEPLRIKISSLTKSGNTITATTEEEHGFVVNANFKINVWGVKQAIYNQTDILVASVPTPTSFTYTVVGNTVSPATSVGNIYCQAQYNDRVFFFTVAGSPTTPATGTITQLITWNGGYNGFYEIATAPDDNTFTYTMSLSGINSPATGTITANTMRIDAAISFERAKALYTAQTVNKYWIIVIPNPETVSKDRKQLTDANYTIRKGNDFSQTIIYNFEVLMFIPSKTSLGDGDIYDLAMDEKINLLKSLVGSYLTSDFNEDGSNELDGVTYLGNQPVAVEDAYYIHSFTFQITGELQSEDIVDQFDTYAFRRIQERYIDENEDDTGLDTDVSF